MAVQLAWKDDNFGPSRPHVVLKTTSGYGAGTFGVWVATDAKGSVRPVGSGRGIVSLEAAVKGAKAANAGERFSD